MNRNVMQVFLDVGLVMSTTNTVFAAAPLTPLRRCAPDAVIVGTVCLDTYEASVWRVPNPTTTNAALVRKIQLGIASQADLTGGGATQLGVNGDNFSSCRDNGQSSRRARVGLGAGIDGVPELGQLQR